MSLTASMWTSVSGLLVHGEKMNVIGNNIANVNTIGFKGSRMDFADFVCQDVGTLSGPAQVGRGVTIGAIYGDFSQGAFETTTDPTDIAIQGNGFYKVVPKNSNEVFYTRAGNFRFDKDGFLVDPNGFVLQGWEIERPEPSLATTTAPAANSSTKSMIKGTGVPQDVKLASFSCEPKHTSNMTIAVNLDRDGTEKSQDATDPFFSLLKHWDASDLKVPPLGSNAFAYQQSMTVYDEGGTSHVVTIYFDQVNNTTAQPLTNSKNSDRYWEYVVTMDPSTDIRDFGDGTTPDPINDKYRGLLMTGTLTFDTSGQLKDMSAYVPTSSNMEMDNTTNAGAWVAAPISSNGYPMFAANFTGREGASNIWDTSGMPTTAAPGTINQNTVGYITELDLGLRNKSNWWSGLTSTDASDVGVDVKNLATVGTNGERQATTSTAFGGDGKLYYERFAKQDGYTFGELSSISVSPDGVLSGRYSNGVSLELYQITLYDFPSKHNLRREGGNLFTQTRESGDPSSGAAGSGSFGSVYSNSIEQSNVDLAREFVQMITTQRGFQANSKSVTTVDSMLDTVINMKR